MESRRCWPCAELSNRCMFESNFPVEKEWVSYSTLWNAFKKITAGYGAVDRRNLFFDTANAFYSLKLPELK